MSQALDAIFFDLDDTLYSTTRFAERARARAVQAMIEAGLDLAPEHLAAELKEVIAEFSANYEHHFDKLLLRIPRRHYRGSNPAIIVAAGVMAYHDTKFRELKPFSDVIPFFQALPPDLVRGIITAGLEVKQAEKLLRIGVYPHLTRNAIFISDQIGISKPNEKLYLRACSDLNLKPARCMYVGDHPTRDIDPTARIGMVAVKVRRGGAHEREGGQMTPTHEVKDFVDLARILRETYGVAVAPFAPAPGLDEGPSAPSGEGPESAAGGGASPAPSPLTLPSVPAEADADEEIPGAEGEG